MIMPGNSRETVVTALEPFTSAPHAAAAEVVNSLEERGFRVVHVDECGELIKRLTALAKDLLPEKNREMHPDLLMAEAFTIMLYDRD